MPDIRSETGGYRGASLDANEQHYDVSDEFFKIWLGPRLAYSSALWDGQEPLEAAQARKTEYLVHQAGIRPGHRVLDVGCGWGAELRPLVETYDVAQAVGITLSERQVAYASAQALPRVDVRLENWIDHRPDTPYDAVISVEAFEHFARPGLPGIKKIQGYRRFFERCHGWLRPGGMLAMQTITWGHRFPLDVGILRDLYVATTVYPECNPAFPTEILRAADGLFDLVALRNDHTHYARTMRVWVERLQADRDRAVELVGRQKATDFERCMTTAVRAFEEGWFYLLRLTFRPCRPPSGPARRFLINNLLGRGSTPVDRLRHRAP